MLAETAVTIPRARTYLGHMKRFAGLGLLVALGLSAWAGSGRAGAAVVQRGKATRVHRSSRLLMGGRVRCTASVRASVEVGQSASVALVLRNVSRRPVKVLSWVFSATAVVKAADGTTYDPNEYDAGLPGIPPPIPVKLRPGAKMLERRVDVPVRWRGPLRITPKCLGKPLPVLRVWVTSPGAPSDESAAVDAVVAGSGHLLDACRPQTPGVPVDGQIDPPTGSAPPMSAQCSLSISPDRAFWVAQVLVLVPPGLQGVQVFQPYELLWPLGSLVGLSSSPPYEAIAWEFVVTRDKATPVAASSLAATNSSGQTAPFFDWHRSGWRQDGTGSCGGTGFAFGGRGPSVEFISACP
jgi:hypothetical protein